jgi:DNA adenine methylase
MASTITKSSPIPTKNNAILKWAGGKSALLDEIFTLLPKGETLLEPFAGSMVVSLNAVDKYENVIVADANADLINLYQQLQTKGLPYAQYCSQYFDPKYQTESEYYVLRDKFNRSKDLEERGALMLYLNKHCFNGLWRVSSSGYNVPIGKNSKGVVHAPDFPLATVTKWLEVVQNNNFTFVCDDYRDVVKKYAIAGCAVYFDPPYIPLPKATAKASHFTRYAKDDFTLKDQRDLAAVAGDLGNRGIPALISNSHTPESLQVFSNGTIHVVSAPRSISADGKGRGKVEEILVRY